MSRGLLLCLSFGFVACADGSSPDAAPHVAVSIAALDLPGVRDAVWDLRVINAVSDTVTNVRLSASRYGDGVASAAYVAPCDASANDNVVEVRLLGIYGAPVASPGTWGEAAPAGALPFVDPGLLRRTVQCQPNADTAVTFDVTVMRPAQQGFFDIAVSFADVFCSAKYDCAGAPLLFDGSDQRAPTHVLGLACTAGPGSTRLHLSDVTVDCGAAGTAVIDPARGPGNLCSAGATPSCAPAVLDPQGLLYQAAVFRGVENQAGSAIAYWNVALGLVPPSGCSVRARATVDDGTVLTGSPAALGEGLTYPYLDWNVDLDACPAAFGLDADEGPVTTRYTHPDDPPTTFAHSVTVDAGPVDPEDPVDPNPVSRGLVFYLDAGEAASYGGSGQVWKNLVTSPADGSAQSAYDFHVGFDASAEGSDPSFSGTAGGHSPSEYFTFDGNDTFRLAAGNTAFINSLHKDGAQFTVILWVRMAGFTNFGNLFGTLGWSGGNPGVLYSFRNGPQHLFYAGAYATPTLDARGAVPTSGTDTMLAVSIDEPGDLGFLYVNGGYDPVNGADTFPAHYTDPPVGDSMCALELGNAGCAVGDNFLYAGTRIYGVRVFNKALTKAEMDAEWLLARARMGL